MRARTCVYSCVCARGCLWRPEDGIRGSEQPMVGARNRTPVLWENKRVLNAEPFLQQNSLFGSHAFCQHVLFSKHSYLHPGQTVPSVRWRRERGELVLHIDLSKLCFLRLSNSKKTDEAQHFLDRKTVLCKTIACRCIYLPEGNNYKILLPRHLPKTYIFMSKCGSWNQFLGVLGWEGVACWLTESSLRGALPELAAGLWDTAFWHPVWFKQDVASVIEYKSGLTDKAFWVFALIYGSLSVIH